MKNQELNFSPRGLATVVIGLCLLAQISAHTLAVLIDNLTKLFFQSLNVLTAIHTNDIIIVQKERGMKYESNIKRTKPKTKDC